jgi:pyrroloquinoline quinone biosynthesis protein D
LKDEPNHGPGQAIQVGEGAGASAPHPGRALRLARHVRLKSDPARGGTVLLAPEAVIELNTQGAEVLSLCDGTRSADAIVAELQERYTGEGIDRQVRDFLDRVQARGWVQSVHPTSTGSG